MLTELKRCVHIQGCKIPFANDAINALPAYHHYYGGILTKSKLFKQIIGRDQSKVSKKFPGTQHNNHTYTVFPKPLQDD